MYFNQAQWLDVQDNFKAKIGKISVEQSLQY